MHIVVHNHVPRPRRRTADAPIGTALSRLKDFLASPKVSKEITHEAMKILGKHSLGVAGHAFRHEYVLPVVHSAVLFGVSQLGGGGVTEAVAAAVAGYAATEIMKKLGLPPEKASELLVAVGRRLLKAYKDWAREYRYKEANVGTGRYGRLHDSVDPLEIGLSRFVEAFE
jgi:hypothetical protein